MHFSWPIDGSIIIIYLIATAAAGLMVRKYVGNVEEFLLAGREMDLNLGIASLAATEFGVVTCMYTAQNAYEFGFAGMTPGILMALAMFFVGVTGFCIKPLRDSGVTTIPELLEKHFGSRIRWWSGMVMVLGGLLATGVFLRSGGEFLVLVCGLNIKYLEITMTIMLLVVLAYTVLGGMLSVLVTDFLQFIVMSIGLIAVSVLILYNVGWNNLTATVAEHYGPGGFNPFVNVKLGWPYVIFNALMNLAVVLTWQTTIARVLAAKDSKTGRKVYTATSFFFVCRFLIPGIWGIAALAILAKGTHSMQAMPIYLSQVVPVGLMGILIAAMLAADMSTDSSYIIAWSSLIYNDLLAPFRKKNPSQKSSLLLNRFLVAAIGLYLLVFGLWFPIKGNLWTYLCIAASIYLASISTLLIAACYWKRSNSWGAAGAIICGAIFPIGFLILQQVDSTKAIAEKIGPYYSGIATYLGAAIAMIIGSLLKPNTTKESQ